MSYQPRMEVILLRDLTGRIFMTLLALSAMLIVGYRLGLMESTLDGLAAKLSYSATGASYIEHSGEGDNQPYTVRCTIERNTKRQSCGIAFILSDDKQQGIDFSRYNRVDVNVRLVRPVGHERLRFYLKNFNDDYSDKDNSRSLKYNSVEFFPSPNFEKISIPFDYFQVATWWLTKRSIPFKSAQFDVTNVPVMEFSTGTISTPGDYIISVKEIVFYGEWISEFTLYKILFVLWLFTAIFILNMHRRLLKNTSHQDALTGVLNRRGLDAWMMEYFVFAKKDMAIFFIDIDDFKRINDNFGHIVGDVLIQGFCENVNASIPHIYSDVSKKMMHTFSRLSGDEFVLVFKGLDVSDVDKIGSRLLQYISELICVDGRNIKINASIGVAINDESVKTPSMFISHADAAMYSSKRRGKNQCRLFDESLSQKIKQQKKISHGLRKSLDGDFFNTVYMPIFSAKERKVTGVEVLLRCGSDELIGVTPDVYIPVAEEYGLIGEIDLWVIEQAFKDISSVPEDKRISYSINISSRELHSQTFIGEVQILQSEYKISSKHILFEITETSLIDADAQSIRFLRHLRSLGFRLALDDFGTGYTAFNQLIEYPVQYLKIDKTFIDKIGTTPNARSSMVDAMISIAHSNHLEVVAEGVETENQVLYMEELNCEYLQGYYLSEPLTWKELNKFLANNMVQ